MPWGDTTLLGHIVAECKRTSYPVWVATSTDPSDDEVAAEATLSRAHVYRGELDNVLARFVGCVDAMPEEPDAIIRICGDRPFLSAALIDAAANVWGGHPAPYTVFGEGSLTVEVVATWKLRDIDKRLPPFSPHREHVTSAMAGIYTWPTTIDERADYIRLRPRSTVLA